MTPENEILHEGKYVRLIDEGGWEYVERIGTSGVVAILAVNDAGKLILVEQYRPAVGRPLVELPAGLAGDVRGQEDEALSLAARRELLEETGYEAAEMELVVAAYPSAGMCREELTLFHARGLKKVGAGGGDASEDIVIHEVPLEDTVAWLEEQQRAGKGIDFKIYTGLYFATR